MSLSPILESDSIDNFPKLFEFSRPPPPCLGAALKLAYHAIASSSATDTCLSTRAAMNRREHRLAQLERCIQEMRSRSSALCQKPSRPGGKKRENDQGEAERFAPPNSPTSAAVIRATRKSEPPCKAKRRRHPPVIRSIATLGAMAVQTVQASTPFF